MADATLRFLNDTVFQLATRCRAYRYAQPMFWSEVGRRYLDLFGRIAAGQAQTERMDRRVFAAPSGKGSMLVHAGAGS